MLSDGEREADRIHMIVGGLEYLAQGFSIFDRELRLVAWNQHYLELLDFPAEMGAFGRPLADFFKYNAERGDYGPGGVDELVDTRIELAKKAEPHCFERVRPNGMAIEVRGTPLPGGGFVTTYTDITERKTWEDSLQRAKRKAEEANRAKSTFLNMVTHDLSTPLTSIRSLTEILSSDSDIDELQRREFLGVVNSECQRLARMLKDLLDFAKIEARSIDWNITDFETSALLKNAVTSLKPMFMEKHIELDLVLPAKVSSVTGDADRLTQVVINLLSNAYKYAPERSGKVSVSLECGPTASTISVSDNGPGIPSEKHEEVFEEFNQVLDANGTAPPGTGLGLAISRRVVEHLGGRIWVESEPPNGTTFRFTIPSTASGGAGKS